MPNYRDTLRELLANAPEDLSDDDLADLAHSAQTISRLSVQAPSAATARPKVDRREAARARLAELDAQPVPDNASDRLRVQRAHERAELLAVITNQVGFTDENGHFVPTGGDPEAA